MPLFTENVPLRYWCTTEIRQPNQNKSISYSVSPLANCSSWAKLKQLLADAMLPPAVKWVELPLGCLPGFSAMAGQ
jgi:hypothetical protein